MLINHNVVLHSSVTPTPSKKMENKCEICYKTFPPDDDLKTNKMTHTEAASFRCTQCNTKYLGALELKKNGTDHSVETSHGGKLSGKNFSRAVDPKIYERFNTGGTPYECNQCGKQFLKTGPLKIHLRVHTGETPYGCHHCDKRFSTFNNLNRHKRVHTGETPFACNQCEKSFSKSGNLKEHKRVHTGENSYACK